MADIPRFAGNEGIGLRLPCVHVVTPVAATLCLAVFGFSLSHHMFAPFGFDHALYQYIVDRVMTGQRMYADLYDHNAPGIIGIHWLSTLLFGPSQMGIRLLDACWQGLTIGAFVLLAGRDSKQWHLGWIASTLYLLAFYGFASTNTAEREGFAVLPMLLAIHAIAPESAPATGRLTARFTRYAIAGVCCLAIVAIKPPLGLCYGVVWIMTLAEALKARRAGLRALVPIAGLTAGFLGAAGGLVLLMMRLDWWCAYLPMLTGQEFPEGYVIGPGMIRLLLPYMGVTALVIIVWVARHHLHPRHPGLGHRKIPAVESIQTIVVGMMVFGLLLTMSNWGAWGDKVLALGGLLVPACLAVAIIPWQDRSRIWRLCALMAGAALMALFIQGRFTPYRLALLLAMMAYPAACEVATSVTGTTRMPRHRQLRAVVCLACVLHLGMGHWWLGVNAHGSVPYIMSRETLQQHYSRINDASRVTVRYATVAQTARRIRDITGPDDRIAMLFYDPRIMYMAQRPPVHRVIIPMDVNRTQYAEFMKGIETGKPTLLVARIPEGYQGGADPKDVERMIFSDAGKLFGPGAEMLRELYALSETIGDVAILRPRVDGISDQSASLSAPRRAIR